MIRNHRSLADVLLLISVSILFFQGRSEGGDQPSSARTVSLPVIVVNSHGDHVSGLNSGSFALAEGGHNVVLESVQEIGPLLVGSNKVKVPFIVLDAYSLANLVELREECLRMLAHAAAEGLPLSLSQMERDGLHEMHTPATPNSVVASALLQLDNQKPFLNNRDQLQAMQNNSDRALVAAEANRLARFRRGIVEANNLMGAVLSQLNSLQQMAMALQHASGRKTVIWLTGYFPVDVNEAEDSLNVGGFGINSPFAVKSASVDYQRTVDMLNDAQISLFPVQIGPGDHSGVNGGSTAVSRSNFDFPSLSNRTDFTETGLRRIARSTGGALLTSSDAIPNVIKLAEDASTNYYQLKFRPEPIKGNLRWKGLKLKLQDKSLRATLPEGLFVFSSK